MSVSFVLVCAIAQGAQIEGIPEPRVLEQVSPVSKGSGEIEPLHDGAVQATAGGQAITYLSSGVTGGSTEGNSNLTQVLSSRTGEGWISRDIATSHEAETSQSVGAGQEYRLFSPDLNSAVVEPFGETPLPPLEEGAEPTPYLRSGLLAGGVVLYTPLVTAANTTPNEHFGEVAYRVHFIASNASLTSLLLKSRAGLTPKALRAENAENLYEWSGGQLKLVSVLPNGKSTTEENKQAFFGYRNGDLRGVVSEDGQQVVWQAEPPGGVHHLYVRDMTSERSTQIDEPQGGSASNSEENDSTYQTTSPDGRVIYFTDDARLTAESKATGGTDDLYACIMSRAEGAPVCQLHDLTSASSAPEGGGVKGVVMGASEDGSYVYFVASGELTSTANGEGETAETGAPNLYVEHLSGESWGPPTFIARLSNEDRPDWGAESSGILGRLTSRVSPNGQFIAFMSERSLTGYNNVDKVSGEHDQEVFLYSLADNRLLCASCDPSGAQPEGILDNGEQNNGNGLLVDQVAGPNQNNWSGHWLAGSIPGWTLIEEGEALYQARYLSNAGRLYFETTDALAPSDSNGKEDVYEYEPGGVPQGPHGCGEADASFAAGIGGCLNLMSGGISSTESALLDVSSSGGETAGGGNGEQGGGDVFFITAARLAGSDIDGSFDVYDAHECTSATPCPAPASAAPAPCASLAACEGLASPAEGNPPFATTFDNGGGNLPAPKGTPKKAGRPTKAHELKLCKRYRSKRRRAACIRSVNRRYAPKRAVKHSVSKKRAK